MFWVLICTVLLTVCYYHITYVFQGESTSYICLIGKELLAWGRCEIWSLNDFNKTWTHRIHNYFVHKWPLNLVVVGSSLIVSHKLQILDLFQARSSLTFRQPWTIGFTLKHVCDIRRIYCQMYRKDKYSRHSSIIWPVWLNGWVFVYEVSDCGFQSCCSHLNFRFCVWFDIQADI